MDKHKGVVNWSAVARTAFEGKIRDMETSQEIEISADVIERLRASKESADNDGFDDGVHWAKRKASRTRLGMV